MFLRLAVPFLSLMLLSGCSAEHSRYQLMRLNDNQAMVIDSKTGLTWNQTYCPDKFKTTTGADCWHIMTYDVAPNKLKAIPDYDSRQEEINRE